MASWDQMSEAEREEANEIAWCNAAARLRQVVERNPQLDMPEARRLASSAIDSDVAEETRLIKRAQLARATKMDVRSAANSPARIQALSLEQGFIYDVEI